MTKNRRRSKAASSHDASTPESAALKDSVGCVSQGDMSPVSLCQAVLRKQLTEGMSTYRNSEKGTYLGEGLHQEERQLLDLLRRTATSGESNSVLVIGSRGSGKSKLIKHVIAELLLDDHIRENLLQVYLNGLLQTDDRIALTEITRQLKLENTLGDKVFDVIELLEKRVKSRFSHRQIHLFNSQTFEDFIVIFKKLLCLDVNFPDQKFADSWNLQVEQLARDPTITDILRQQFEFTKDVRALQQLLMYPVCQLSEMSPSLSVSDFVESRKLITMDSKSAMLHGVSILELCLIIAMKHLTEIYEGEPFNFEMVYSEYSKFAQRKSSMQVFEKAVVLKAFEHLIHLELVRTVDGAGSRVQKEYRLMQMLIHPTQILDALQKYPQCPTDVRQWAASSLAT